MMVDHVNDPCNYLANVSGDRTLYGVMTGKSLLEVPENILMDCWEKSEEFNAEFDPWAVLIVYPVKCNLVGLWGIESYVLIPDVEMEEVDWVQHKFPHPDLVRKHWIEFLGSRKNLYS